MQTDDTLDAINIANSVQPDGSNITPRGAIPGAKSRRRGVDSELDSCRPMRKFMTGIDPRCAKLDAGQVLRAAYSLLLRRWASGREGRDEAGKTRVGKLADWGSVGPNR